VFTTFLFACKTEKKVDQEEVMMEELRRTIEADNAAVELATYEYVCAHCKIGSHEVGSCPCGMEFVKNAEFRMGNNHDHEAHLCECPHCIEGTCTAGEGECLCTDACKMQKNHKEVEKES